MVEEARYFSIFKQQKARITKKISYHHKHVAKIYEKAAHHNEATKHHGSRQL